jgi:signal transduction histidine kinase
MKVGHRNRQPLRELPSAARPSAARQAPTFFWQAAFILLPVTLMAAFGFWAILHQRRMVEQDAQTRAREIVQGLPDDFGRMVAADLAQLEGYASGWQYYLENVETPWPTSPSRQQLLSDPNESSAISNGLARLQTVFPDWDGGVPPVATFALDGRGFPAGQPPAPPQPPAWVAALTPPQQTAWTELETADLASQPRSQLAELAAKLKKTDPPPDAEICAEFFVLRAELRDTPTTNGATPLIEFANRHDGVRSGSGLPLTSLALAGALGSRPGQEPTAALWGALRTEAMQGGFLAPRLLNEAAKRVQADRALPKSIQAMRIVLAERQRRWALAEAMARTGYTPGTATTNLWISLPDQHWLCLINESGATVSNQFILSVAAKPEVSCYPESAVRRALSNALARAKVALPDYFSLTCELAGRSLPLPAAWGKAAGHTTNTQVLAETRFQMSSPAIIDQPRMEPAPDIVSEAMPGHPTITLQVFLADRRLMYARQRELQWIFGSLIALSLGTALVGLAAARRAFRRQLQLNEQKSNFVSSVSHELRAPIASVRLMAENLERGKIVGPGKQAEYYRFIVQECRRLSSLIENVLDVSRIEQGRKQYEFEPTDLRALMTATVKLMAPYAAEKDVRLEFQAPPNAAAAEQDVDGRAIQQALVNLIDNAVKHSPKGEAVTVTLETPAPRDAPMRLAVADHGPGIPRAEYEKIFERFYRLGSELRRETQGVGIGLSIVRHVTEAHGGRVWVESELGHGSRFIIELPNSGVHAY